MNGDSRAERLSALVAEEGLKGALALLQETSGTSCTPARPNATPAPTCGG